MTGGIPLKSFCNKIKMNDSHRLGAWIILFKGKREIPVFLKYHLSREE